MWYNKFAPGFMCVRRKTHPFGNERHTKCCGLTEILWRIHIFKGKDILAQLGTKLHLDLGRTVVPMICIRKPLFYIGVSILMDSGFCAANGIVALVPKGVYVGALIEKPQNWPKSVPGDLIDRNFADKEVGDEDILEAAT